jgi:hypothetical protein
MYSEWVVDDILLSKVEGAPPGPAWAGGPATTGIIGIDKETYKVKKGSSSELNEKSRG